MNVKVVTNKEAKDETLRRGLHWNLIQDVKREMQAEELRRAILQASDLTDIKEILLYITGASK